MNDNDIKNAWLDEDLNRFWEAALIFVLGESFECSRV
jgi:hypothetical protein